MRKLTPASLAVWILIAWLLTGGSLPIVAPATVTAATYVHDEKAVIPSGVLAALNELNAKGIVATAFPDDATDNEDQIPDQYKHTLPAARAAGIPALVIQSGDKILRTIKAPTTREQVIEAAK